MTIAAGRTCYIHIGTHKTGTTSIQHALSNAHAALPAHGLYYPLAGRPADAGIPGHHKVAWDIQAGRPHAPSSVLAEIKDLPQDVILSSEDFSGAVIEHPARFNYFVDLLKGQGFDVVLIIYFRNHLDYLPRVYLQMIAGGWDLGWRDTWEMNVPPTSRARTLLSHWQRPAELKSVFLSYLDLLQNAHRSGARQVIVRQYNPGKISACSDFLSLFGLTLADVGATNERTENVSFSLREYLLTFARNRKGGEISDAEQKAIISSAPPADAPIRLSHREAEKIRIQFQETNQILQREYGIPDPHYADAETKWGVDTLFL